MDTWPFLFPAALLSLPLIGLPVVLHLLFRRKAPIVQFSTLQFIKASVRQTAARRKVRRWLLLACRMLLLLLLIWSVAQPVRRYFASWAGTSSVAAAIVVDTSYSMQLRDHGTTLLSRADDAVKKLLHEDLSDGSVAIFRSQPNPAGERFNSPSQILTEWSNLQPQPSPGALVDRVATAEAALEQRPEDHKWLFVLTDLQDREFPRQISDFPDGRTVLMDLHPPDVRAAALSDVQIEPKQARLGVEGQIGVEVIGKPSDSRAVVLNISTVNDPQKKLQQPALDIARFDSGGRATLTAPYTFSTPSWLMLTAELQQPDDLTWANSRTQLVSVPAPAAAQVLTLPPPNRQADAILRLALDPSEGGWPDWPISVRQPSDTLAGDEAIVAMNVTRWPDEVMARKLHNFVWRGGTLVLFVQPGLETQWGTLAVGQMQAWLDLLPGTPAQQTVEQHEQVAQGPFRCSIARTNDVLLSDVGKIEAAGGVLRVDRIVPFDVSDISVIPILNAAPENPNGDSDLRGLLYRRAIGTGQVYTWATLPTPQYGNLPAYELFLPMLVNSSIRPQVEAAAMNVEIGFPIVLPGQAANGSDMLDLVPPTGPAEQIHATQNATGRNFVSEPMTTPGLYTWKRGEQVVAYTNVQYPAAEAHLDYRKPDEAIAAGPNVIFVHSLAELEQRLREADEPKPQWSIPLAIVMLLLCLESLFGSMGKGRSGKAATPALVAA